MSVPTIENEQAGSVVDSSGSGQTLMADGADTSAPSGPSVTFSFSDGSNVTLDQEDIQVYMLTIQTLLLLYVTYQEVSR